MIMLSISYGIKDVLGFIHYINTRLWGSMCTSKLLSWPCINDNTVTDSLLVKTNHCLVNSFFIMILFFLYVTSKKPFPTYKIFMSLVAYDRLLLLTHLHPMCLLWLISKVHHIIFITWFYSLCISEIHHRLHHKGCN